MMTLNSVNKLEDLQSVIDLGTTPLVTMAEILEEQLSTIEMPDRTYHIGLQVLSLANGLKEALIRLEADRVESCRTAGKLLGLDWQ